MGLFSKKKPRVVVSSDPIVSYRISQNLAGRLTVTPNVQNAYTYSITLGVKKAWRDTIEVTIHRSVNSSFQHGDDPVGQCLIQTSQGKFLGCKVDAFSKDIKIDRKGSNSDLVKAEYTLAVPKLGKFKWEHDNALIIGADKHLKMTSLDSGAVLARFGGAERGHGEFGTLEIYDDGVAGDKDWCGLCVLTAVCVYAREVRNRDRKRGGGGLAGAVNTWGGLITGIPMPSQSS